MDKNRPIDQVIPDPPIQKTLSAAARRALDEAAARRQAISSANVLPTELNGREGPEPVRYGDWEVKGLASDF